MTPAAGGLGGIELATAEGEAIALDAFGGRPLVIVCVRYYG